MRKILLATTALVALTGAAYAAESPITVTVGGYVDFRAAMFHEASDSVNGSVGERRSHDFETEYRLNIAAEGKAANGIEYGGLISLWNGADYTGTAPFQGGGNQVHEDQGYVWMSGAWGKVILGDDHGASDLFVYAPTVGEGQIDGTYTDFTDPNTLAKLQPTFIDNTENSTKITYYTPKVGNANNKVQLGASFAPNFYDQGQNVVKYNPTTAPTAVGDLYQDYVEATAQYTGNWSPVSTVLSANLQTASRGNSLNTGSLVRDFTAWGVGGQASYMGFTFGSSYVDAGRYGTLESHTTGIGQDKDQSVWTAGLKYEFDKVALAINGMRGQGYDNNLVTAAGAGTIATVQQAKYVKDFSALGLGATYTWFPGLTTAADAVFFDQQRDDTKDAGGSPDKPNSGQVLMLSQKITF